MTKINKKEYEILKGLDDRWEWIARDDNYDASLFCFEDKPYKSMEIGAWGPNVVQYEYLGRHDSKFQFIQWEDEEPYNIAKLIEEYEDKEFYDYVGWKYAESEEAEVNKDIQWLKKEIHKELEDWHGVEGGIDGDGINEIMLLINQYEESEVKRLERKIRELDSYNDELIRDSNQLRNAMDNQEVLSQEFIDDESMSVLDTFNRHILAVPVDKLKNLLVPKEGITYEDALKVIAENIDTDEFSIGLYLKALNNNEKYEFLTEKWIESNTSPVDDEGRLYVWKKDLQDVLVPKQELPVIPKFVADWYEEHKDNLEKQLQGIAFNLDKHGEMPEVSGIDKWINETERPVQTSASLKFGYEVEEEQKYYLVLPNIDGMEYKYSFIDEEGEMDAVDDKKHIAELGKQFTEQEIKDYDKRYFPFAVKVEELEE